MVPRHSKRNKWLCSRKTCKGEKSVDQEHEIMNFTPKLNKNRMKIKFGKQSVYCLVDSGAEISAISKHLLDQVAPNAEIEPSSLSNIIGVCG